jgi:ATPase subunit of ABC transporter with duplicated ATPase domains
VSIADVSTMLNTFVRAVEAREAQARKAAQKQQRMHAQMQLTCEKLSSFATSPATEQQHQARLDARERAQPTNWTVPLLPRRGGCSVDVEAYIPPTLDDDAVES